eukprot:10021501-Ditylum_brightwellii.AAC.1
MSDLGEWTSLPHMQTERCTCAAVSMDGNIYAIGGHDGSSRLSCMEVFNSISREWTPLPHMKSKRHACAAVSMGGGNLCHGRLRRKQ